MSLRALALTVCLSLTSLSMGCLATGAEETEEERDAELAGAIDIPEESASELEGEQPTDDDGEEEDAAQPPPPPDSVERAEPELAWYVSGCSVTNCKMSDMWNRLDGQRLADGAHLFGGRGNDRGRAESRALNVNFGMRRIIEVAGKKDTFVYAWNVDMETGGNLSGWVRERLVNGGRGASMPTIRNPRRPSGTKAYRFRTEAQTKAILAKYGDLKVSAYKPEDRGSNVVSHYLARTDEHINMTQGIPGRSPGLANDTFGVLDPSLRFVPAVAAKDTRVRIRLFRNDGRGTPSAYSMTFVYGRVGGRRGWIAKLALR